MSFLGDPFEHDLFVSYSHGDFDGSGESNLSKWSQAFVNQLEGELRQAPKFNDLKIFLDQHHRPDQRVDPLQELTRQLRDDIEASGLLTVLMSPHYLLSKWCADERDWWLSCQQKFGLETDGRIAIARVWPTEEAWPGAFTDEREVPLVGITFYDKKNAEFHPQPYEWPDPTGAGGPFREALLDMVGWIWQKLGGLKNQLEERHRHVQDAERLAAESGQVVYLHAREAHTKAWELTGEALTDKGFVVLPTTPDPVERDPLLAREIAERRVETLSGCDGLLLVGTDDGRALEADLVVVGRQDRHSARERSDRHLPSAVVNTDADNPVSPRRKSVAHSLGISWIDAIEPDWTTDVRKWLVDASSAVAEL